MNYVSDGTKMLTWGQPPELRTVILSEAKDPCIAGPLIKRFKAFSPSFVKAPCKCLKPALQIAAPPGSFDSAISLRELAALRMTESEIVPKPKTCQKRKVARAHGPYSYASASMGSLRAALNAG
jgi:hypothetical protein